MANAINVTSKLSATFSAEVFTNTLTTLNTVPETTSTKGAHIAQTVGTAREAVLIGDVDITNATGNDYWLQLRNVDATNYVTVEMQYGAATYLQIGMMRPGGSWGPNLLPKLDGSGYNGIFLDADTADCLVVGVAAEAGDPAA